MGKKIKIIFPFILIAFIIFPLIKPLLEPGFFISDDGEWMIIRLAAFHQTLKSGQFPVRFLYSLNHGYGYPVINFLYPLAFYIGELIHLTGFGFIDSVKLLFIAGFVLGGIFMYLFTSHNYGAKAGFIGAVIYTYAPYRIFDVYKRGSLGESVAFIFIPLIFYFLNILARKITVPVLSLTSLSISALILSHNVLAFLFLPIISTYMILISFNSKYYLRMTAFMISILILALLLTSFFWFPALYELRYVKANSVQIANYKDYFLSLKNIFNLIGVPTMLIMGLSLIVKKRRSETFFLGIVLTSLFFASVLSLPFWGNGLFPRTIQFPWRFLSITVFGVGVLGASLFRQKTILISLLALMMIIASRENINIKRINQPNSYYISNDDTTTVKKEYMPIWVKSDPRNIPPNKLEIVNGEGYVKGNVIFAKTVLSVRYNTVYYPGWKVWLNDIESKIYYDDGFIEIIVPQGENKFTAKFTETFPRKLSNFISFMSFIGIVMVNIFSTKVKFQL